MHAEEIVRMAIRSGFDEAVATVSAENSSYLKLANSGIDSIVEKRYSYATLFVTSKNRIFFADIQNPSRDDALNSIRLARQQMRFIAAKEDYRGIAEGPFEYARGGKVPVEMRDYGQDALVDIAESMLSGASISRSAEIAGTVHMSMSDYELYTSNGLYGKGSYPAVGASIRVIGKETSFQDFLVSRGLKGNDFEGFGRNASEMLSAAKSTGKIRPGKYDVVYLQSPGGSLLSNVTSQACISSVETGSFLGGKLGQKVADSNVTVYDSGAERGGVGFSAFDDEGYPTQRTAVIKDGVLKNYLHNSSTAKKYGTKSTGNAGLVSPRPNTLLFRHRKTVNDVHALLGEMRKGLLVTNTWYTRFSNYLTGDFSTVPRDLTFYVEDGEPKFAIRQVKKIGSFIGVRISDNMLRMMGNAECAAMDMRQSTSWESEGTYYTMPSVLIRDVSVTTS